MRHDLSNLGQNRIADPSAIKARLLTSASPLAAAAREPHRGFRVRKSTWDWILAAAKQPRRSLGHMTLRLIYKSKRRIRRMQQALKNKVHQQRHPVRAAAEPKRQPFAGMFALEPRIVFDAAAAATADHAADQVAKQQAADAIDGPGAASEASAAHEPMSDTDGIVFAPADAPIESPRIEIAFVDATVTNVQSLLAGIPSGVEVVLIDPAKDGIDQIAQALAGRQDIDAIHILSHGSEGQLQLGTANLNAESMATTYKAELATIKAALSDSADILIYGCDFAQGADGDAAARELSRLTGADVAASTDDTGAAALGGDWVLETNIGSIETAALVIDPYNGVLSQNNTGTWSIAGTTATNTTAGVTTTISFGSFSNGTTSVTNVGNETLNNIAVFSPGVQNTASVVADFNWDTSPETNTSEASTDAGTGIVTINFSQAVTNPILHLDRMGGSAGPLQNGLQLTLLTGGVTLTRLNGTGHFSVNAGAGTITNSQIDLATGGSYNSESNTSITQGPDDGSCDAAGAKHKSG